MLWDAEVCCVQDAGPQFIPNPVPSLSEPISDAILNADAAGLCTQHAGHVLEEHEAWPISFHYREVGLEQVVAIVMVHSVLVTDAAGHGVSLTWRPADDQIDPPRFGHELIKPRM